MGIHRAAPAAFVLLLAHASGCDDSRFPVCKTNEDCTGRDGGKSAGVCYNLKCVECHYDGDCPHGACTSKNECEQLVNVKPVKERPAGPADPKGWEYGTWDQCAADCKDPECLKVCDQKFNK